MIKASNSGQSLTANQVIPLTLVSNTNTRLSLSNNSIVANDAGILDIDASFVITATGAGNISIQLYDGTTALSPIYTATFGASGDIKTFIINDKEIILRSYPTSKVNLNFVVSGACTLNSAYVVASY